MIKIDKAIEMAIGSISSSKMRSALTTLGIIIGVAAVIANLSLGASFSQYFNNEVGSVGSNFIVVSSQNINVFFDNQLQIVKNTPGVVGVSPINQQMAKVKYLSASRQIDIQGVTEDYENIANLKIEKGDFLSDKDRYIAVIGSDIAYNKFGKNLSINNPIQVTFRKYDGNITTQKFIIKGILQDPKSSVQSGIESNTRIFIPINTMNEILDHNDYMGFFIKAESLESINTTRQEIDKGLARSLGITARDFDNPDAKPYNLLDQSEILNQVNQMSSALTALLTVVALISLVVGSIGIMNIMLVTVTERTQEIGLMKSLGFNNKDILLLFLVQSMIVSLIGGVIGIILGITGAYLANIFLELPNIFPWMEIIIGFLVSIMVGLFAGIYPANKAAKMDPIEALRHE